MADINLTDMKDILNLNSSINAMPPELVSKFANLITIFKTVGIIFIIYICNSSTSNINLCLVIDFYI